MSPDAGASSRRSNCSLVKERPRRTNPKRVANCNEIKVAVKGVGCPRQGISQGKCTDAWAPVAFRVSIALGAA